MVPRRPVLVLALLAALTACSDQATGVPTAGVTTPRSTTAGGPFPSTPSRSADTGGAANRPKGPMADVAPCSLLTSTEVAELQAGPSKEETINKARACRFTEAKGFTMSVAIFDELGLDDLVARGTPKPVTVGNRKALQSIGGIDTCAISIELTNTSRVDTQGTAGGDEQKSCDIALKVARLVEPKLPTG
ncbi:DUF3558 family protein [Kibdelosporangium banguiense]|nr:DUF3558 family protein [Kibdelosporangium banguiense]